MDILVAVIRPKNTVTILSEYRPKNFDVLLVDIRTSSVDKAKSLKQFPKFNAALGQDVTRHLGDFLYQLTGSEKGGLVAKRSTFIPTPVPPDQQELHQKGSLYCLLVDHKAKLNPSHVDNIPSTPGFYQLDYVIDSCKTNTTIYSRHSRFMIHKLDEWLKERYLIPGAMEVFLSAAPRMRIKKVIHNPAFVTSSTLSGSTEMLSGTKAEEIQSSANVVLAKMMAIEKCDIVVMNNLYGTSQVYKHKVDALAVNRFWGMGKPDVDRVSISPLPKFSDVNYSTSFPVHHYACKGDASHVRQLLRSNYQLSTQLDRNSWAAIHYAACYGHLEVVRVLMEEGKCSPNILTENLSTPLHFAAVHGHPNVVHYLLDSKNIDVNALDRDGRSALDLCERVSRPNYKDCARYLRAARERPYQNIKVYLMDTKHQMLDLVSGDNTTVQQLNVQIFKKLGLPSECKDMFTIWICSRNLQLQLKWDHRPKQHLNDWKQIVKMYTDFDPNKEDPKLFWKRDARLSVVQEKKNKNIMATHLLFHETYHCYIKGLYPCAEQDAVILGAMIMLLEHGTYESKKAKSILIEKNLQYLVPEALIKYSNKSMKFWGSKVQSKYKSLSSRFDSPTPEFLKYYFLVVCWNLKVYGSAFFSGSIQPRVTGNSRSSTSSDFVHVGINDIGVHIIHGQSKMMMHTFDYKAIDWGEWRPPDSSTQYLEIVLKHVPRSQPGIRIRTKQAELAVQLMTKLHERNIALGR